MATIRPKPAHREREGARDRILRAAEHVFAERGFSGARTRDIARRAGTNISQLHYYFGSKRKLYLAVVARYFEAVTVSLERALAAPGTPEDRIARVVGAHFDTLSENPWFPRLMIDAVLQAPEVARRVAGEVLRPVLDRLVPLFLDAARSGLVRPIDARHVILSAIAMNVMYFLARPQVNAIFGPQAFSPEALRARREAVIDLLLHGVARPKEERS